MILQGLKRIFPDHRDFDFHRSFGSPTTLPSFPPEYSTDAGFWMPSQNAMGAPYGCTGFSGADACSDEDGVQYDPLDLYRRTPPGLNDQGRDIRVMLGVTINQGLKRWLLTEEPNYKRKAYFQVRGSGVIDQFDAIRLAMLSTRDEKRAVIAGIPWFQEFQAAGQDGVLKMPHDLGVSRATWHCIKIAGWTTINGVSYLMVKSWQGSDYGAGGWAYMSRELCNTLFAINGSAAFTVSKVAPGQIVTVDLGAVDLIISYVRHLLRLS